MKIAKLNGRSLHPALVAFLFVVVCALTTMTFAQQNLVYIDGNIITTGQNAVIGLVNDGTGHLTPLPGSPFLTGGTGVGPAANGADAQWDSDQEVVINPEGTLLFAVNGHSNNFAVFDLNSDGTLTPITGSPFASGGPQPASFGYKDNALGAAVSMMVVVNKDADPLQTPTAPNYTTFTVSSSGVPTLNAGSTFTLPVGAAPGQALIRRGAPTGFFGVEFMSGKISSYKLNRSGILTTTNSLTVPGPKPVDVGAVLHPTVRGLYLALPGDQQIAVYSYNTTGTLRFLRTVANSGNTVCWLAVNAAGTRLYSSEPVSGTISVYDLTNPKIPVQLQHLAVSGTGATPAHMRLDPTGNFLYVLDRLAVLHVLNVNTDGTVTENLTPYNLGLPTGTVPLGLAVLIK
jgi:6-phosphogluconolactonase (cycloisomerase 2 family)